MKLSFRAMCGRGGHPPPVVSWPGLKATGQIHQYVGRKFDKQTRQHRAVEDPAVVDSDTKDGRRLAHLCRRDDALWPADEATAAACGKPFMPLEQDKETGEWIPKGFAWNPRTSSWERTSAPQASTRRKGDD